MPGTVRIKHSPFSSILNWQGDIEILKDVLNTHILLDFNLPYGKKIAVKTKKESVG